MRFVFGIYMQLGIFRSLDLIILKIKDSQQKKLSKGIDEIFRNSSKGISSGTSIPPLFHYTDASGTIGIIQNRCLWATSINFLNDPDELVYGAKTILESFEESRIDETFKVTLNAFFDISKNSIFDGTSDTSDIHVISFCEKPEILGQWRLYGRNGNGYCHGLDFSKKYMLGPVEGDAEYGDYSIIDKPKRVLYDKAEQTNFLTNLFEELDKFLVDFFQKEGIKKSSDEAIGIYFELGHHVLKKCLPIIKRPEFYEEKEWRIVVNHANFKTKRYFREGNGCINPYIRIGFFELGEGTDEQGRLAFDPSQVPVNEIIVGSSLEFATAKMGLEILLKDYGMDEVDIKKSSINFR
jgi:hypothetical protein